MYYNMIIQVLYEYHTFLEKHKGHRFNEDK